jgi:hypothetical protein
MIQLVGCGVVDAEDHLNSGGSRSVSPLAIRFGCIPSSNNLKNHPFQSFDPQISLVDTPRYDVRQSRQGVGFRRCDKQEDVFPSEQVRVTENFHLYMPFETIQEDMVSVRNDIVSVDKGVVTKAEQKLTCGVPP